MGTVCRNPDDNRHDATHMRCSDEANSWREKAGDGSLGTGGGAGGEAGVGVSGGRACAWGDNKVLGTVATSCTGM